MLTRRRHQEHEAVTAARNEIRQHPRVWRCAEQQHCHLLVVATDVVTGTTQVAQRVASVAVVDRHPAIGIVSNACRHGVGIGTDVDGWTAGLQRFGIGPRRSEVNILTVVLGGVVAPQRAYRQRPFAHDGPAILERAAMVFDSFLDPAAGNAEQHAPAGQMIETGNRLGGNDRVAFGQQTHAGAELYTLRDSRAGGERGDRVMHARERFDDVAAVIAVLAMYDRHMAVLGKEQHIEVAFLDRARQRRRRQGHVGRQQADAETWARIHTRAGWNSRMNGGWRRHRRPAIKPPSTTKAWPVT